MKKIAAIAAALCLLAGCLSGCGSTEIRSYSKEGDASARDMSSVYKAYDPKTVVLTVNGDKITWQEYFYWLNSMVLSLDQENKTQIEDWTAASGKEEGKSYAQYAAEQIKQAILQYHVVNAKAAEMKITLTDADQESLKSTLKTNITNYCGSSGTEDQFNTYLGTLYMTRDYYDYINRVMLLYYDIFDSVMGANGEKCSDDETMIFAQDNSYITADHILFSTEDSSGNALSDDEIAQKKADAQKAADELQGITDQAARLKRFKELKAKYTEDTGATSYPDGYCFTKGQVVDEFQTAAEALSEYEVSAPVKSDYGYHVILRLPNTPENIVSVGSDGTTRTLRYYAAVDRFNTLVGTWIGAADVQWQGDFAKLDIAALLKK